MCSSQTITTWQVSVPKRRIFTHPTILLVLNALKDQNKVGYTIHFAAATSIIVHFLIGVVAINLSSTLQGIGRPPTAALVVAREVEKSWLENQGWEGGLDPLDQPWITDVGHSELHDQGICNTFFCHHTVLLSSTVPIFSMKDINSCVIAARCLLLWKYSPQIHENGHFPSDIPKSWFSSQSTFSREHWQICNRQQIHLLFTKHSKITDTTL